jgi:hypothetical protein
MSTGKYLPSLQNTLLLSCSDRHSHAHAEGAIQFLLTLVCLMNN